MKLGQSTKFLKRVGIERRFYYPPKNTQIDIINQPGVGHYVFYPHTGWVIYGLLGWRYQKRQDAHITIDHLVNYKLSVYNNFW